MNKIKRILSFVIVICMLSVMFTYASDHEEYVAENAVRLEAEESEVFGGAGVYGTKVGNIVNNGAGLTFHDVPAGDTLTIRYASAFDGQMTLYIGGTEVKVLDFKTTWPNQWDVFENLVIENVNILQGSSIMLRKDNDGLPPADIDYIEISGTETGEEFGITKVAGDFSCNLEAEQFEMADGAFAENEEAASDGQVASLLTYGSKITYNNVAAGNQLDIRYAAADSNGGKLILKINNNEYNVEFPSTMDYSAYYMTAVRTIVPDGATISLEYGDDCRPVKIDYIRSVKIEEGNVTAKNMYVTGNAFKVNDIGSGDGVAVCLDNSNTVKILKSSQGHNLNIRYKSTEDINLNLYVNSETIYGFTLPSTDGGFCTEIIDVDIPQSSNLEFSFDNEVIVDSITIGKDLSSKRNIINLNGFWDCQSSNEAEIIPDEFNHQVMVPGLVDVAYPVLPWVTPDKTVPPQPDFEYVFYKKNISISGNVPDTALLKISKAAYGKKIWINGHLVGEHQPNYTAAYIDVAPYLKGNNAVNTIIIRVGRRGTQPVGVNAGEDIERRNYYPGIFDDVSLILTGNEYISYLKHAVDIDNHTITVGVGMENYSGTNISPEVSIRVYDEETNETIGSGVLNFDAVSNAQEDYRTVTFDISNYDLWTVDNPKLYRLEATTANDCFSTRIGIRTFYFDGETKIPMLNGNPYYLRGTHFAMYRFFEDSERLSLPWDKEWSREVIRMQKDLNFNSIRSHISFMPEHWIETCDELGLLIQEEYPIWRPYAKYGDQLFDNQANAETTIPEIKDWIEERNNHPCIIIWDICNETDLEETGKIIDACRSEDLQNRPWDNGWAKPRSGTDMIEYHPYYEAFNQTWNTSQLENHKWEEIDYMPIPNGAVVNEYGFIWINRNNTPGSLATDYYHSQFPDATGKERRVAYATTIAQQTEYFRTRRFAGVQYFAGLNYCRPLFQTGATSDNYLPGIYNLRYDPDFRRIINNSMAPVCLMIDYWKRSEIAGASVDIPVFVSNDSMSDWNGNITVKIIDAENGTVYDSTSFDTGIIAMGERIKNVVTLTFPQTEERCRVVACYEDYNINSVPVESFRDVETKLNSVDKITSINATSDAVFVKNKYAYDLYSSNNDEISISALTDENSTLFINGVKGKTKEITNETNVNVVGMKDAFSDEENLVARYSFDSESYKGNTDETSTERLYLAQNAELNDCSVFPDAATGGTSVGDFYQKPNASLSFVAENSGNTLDVSIVNASTDASAKVYVNGEFKTNIVLSGNNNCSIEINEGDTIKLADFTGWTYISRFCIRTTKEINYIDDSGKGHILTSVKTSVNSSGKNGNSMRTFGNGSYAVVTPEKAEGLDGLNQITISAWVNIESNYIATAMVQNRDVILKGGEDGYSYRVMIGADKTVQFVVATDRTGWYENGANVITAPSTIHSGRWYHIVCTYNGQEAAVYIDGKKTASAPLTGTILYTNEELYIGGSPEINSTEPGMIDEVEIYKRALTDYEIAKLYNSQNTADTYRLSIVRKGGNIVENNSAKIYYDVSGTGEMWGMWETFPCELDYSSQYKMSTSKGHYAKMTFEGNYIRYVARKTLNGGKGEVFIDGTSQGIIDFYGDERQAVVFEKHLTQGSHTIKIVNTGTKNNLSTGNYIGIDYLYYETIKEGLFDNVTSGEQLGGILADNYESLGLPADEYDNLEKWGQIYEIMLPIMKLDGNSVSSALNEATAVHNINNASVDTVIETIAQYDDSAVKIKEKLTLSQKTAIAQDIIDNTNYNRLKQVTDLFKSSAGYNFVNSLSSDDVVSFIADSELLCLLGINVSETSETYLDMNAQAKASVNGELMKLKPFADISAFVTAFNSSVNGYKPTVNPVPSTGGGGGGGSATANKQQLVMPEPPKAEQNNGFLDLNGFEWAREAISYLNLSNIINGFNKTEFKPYENVTREQFVKMIVCAFNLNDETAQCDFNDVKSTNWCYPYVAAAKKYGIVNGLTKDVFGCGMNITREDMATILARALEVKGIILKSDNVEHFEDHDYISEYAINSVYSMRSHGIINGTSENKFEPKRNANRAEAAKIIYESIK